MNRALPVLVAIIAVFGMIPAPVAAVEDPRFEVYVPEPQLQPGTQQELTVQLVNDAEDADDRVQTAANVKVTAKQGQTPFEVISGTRLLGPMEDGVPQTVSFRIEVPSNASGGTYRIPLEITYEFDGDERETTTVFAAVTIPDRPIFEVRSVSSDLFLEETGVVTVTMENVGSQTARDTSLAISSMNPALTLGGTQSTTKFVGRWAPGEEKEVPFAVTTTQSAIAKEYTFNVEPTYRNANDITRQAPAVSFGVAPTDGNRFAVVESNTDVAVGETGRLQVTLRNQGNTTISEASVRFESTSPALSFGEQPVATEFVGRWEPGETKDVSADLTARPSTESLQQSVQTSVTFRHPSGTASQSGPYETAVSISPLQRFSYSDVSVTMRGNSALLRTTVRNDGPGAAIDAVVTLQSAAPSVQVTDPTAAVGTLSEGETAEATFELRIAPDANPGPRQFDAQVEYRRPRYQETYRSTPVSIRGDIDTTQQLFEVESQNATFDIDSTNQLRVTITNNGDERLTDIRARLEAAPPYESQNPSSYISALDPGESATVAFEVTTPDDAISTTDAIPVNITAEAPNGQTVVAGPYLVSFTIEETGAGASDTTALAVGAVVVIVILGVGWWWLNR